MRPLIACLAPHTETNILLAELARLLEFDSLKTIFISGIETQTPPVFYFLINPGHNASESTHFKHSLEAILNGFINQFNTLTLEEQRNMLTEMFELAKRKQKNNETKSAFTHYRAAQFVYTLLHEKCAADTKTMRHCFLNIEINLKKENEHALAHEEKEFATLFETSLNLNYQSKKTSIEPVKIHFIKPTLAELKNAELLIFDYSSAIRNPQKQHILSSKSFLNNLSNPSKSAESANTSPKNIP